MVNVLGLVETEKQQSSGTLGARYLKGDMVAGCGRHLAGEPAWLRRHKD